VTTYAPAPVGSPKMDDYGIDGADLLDQVSAFLKRFLAYPSDDARVAHTLWIAHTHFMDRWDSTPRIAFLSPEPGSGKSRCLEVTEPLVPRPVHAVNTTPAYLFRKVSDPDGAPTLLYDEIDTVFGPKAKDNEEVRGMLNAGHRRGATAGRCVVHGKTVETEELPAYCAVALAGLNDLPDTIMTRSVIVRMRRRAPGELVEPWRPRLNHPEAHELRDLLIAWSEEEHAEAWPLMPDGVEDRHADVWEALLAVADLAGGGWPKQARVTAVSLVTQLSGPSGSIGVMLLHDLRKVFGNAEHLTTEVVLTRLHALEDSPWADIKGRPIDARWLSRQLGKYEVKPKVHRTGPGTRRGYAAADLRDPWTRYVKAPEKEDEETDDPPVVTPGDDPIGNIGDEEREVHGQGELDLAPLAPQNCVTTETGVTRLGIGHQPGRCPDCEMHVETQGHGGGCRRPRETS
jgi:hypothetical protein